MSSNQFTSVHVGTGITKIHSHSVSYTWIIEDFNFHEEKGDELKSPFFSAKSNDKYKWHLSLDPAVEVVDQDENDISLYLELQQNNDLPKVFAKFTIYLLDDQLEVLNQTSNTHNEEVNKLDPKTKLKENERWGWSDFLTKNDKFRSTYLINNKLTIQCDLTFSEMRKNDVFCYEVPICDMTESIAKLYEDRDFADVIISVSGKDFPAHKSILCARSPVFAAMFKHNTKEKQLNRVEIKDMKEKEVGEMLRYIYTGRCENLATLAEGLLAAADKYGLDRLKIMCGEALFKSLSVENAANIVVFAEMYGVNLLKTKTIEFIVRRFDQVMNTKGWKSVLANPQLTNEICLALFKR